jgi:MATE family multidrug resistance protein
MMGWLGATELAAHQIAINMCAITFMLVLGVSFAANIRVGYAAGRDDYRAAQRIGLGALSFSFFLMLLFALIFYFGRFYFPSLYIDDPEVQAIAASLLVIGAFFQIFDGLQAVSIGCLRGLTDVMIPTLVTLFAYWLVGLGSAYLLAFHFGFGERGIWYGLAASLALAAALLSFRFFVLTQKLRRPS